MTTFWAEARKHRDVTFSNIAFLIVIVVISFIFCFMTVGLYILALEGAGQWPLPDGADLTIVLAISISIDILAGWYVIGQMKSGFNREREREVKEVERQRIIRWTPAYIREMSDEGLETLFIQVFAERNRRSLKKREREQ